MNDIPIVKAIVIAVFIMILLSLAAAGLKLFRGRDREGTGMVKALTLRVGLSIGLIALIVVLDALGIISPNG